MNAAADRITTLRRVAWACAALVLAITTLSAFIRLSQAGLGCEPWPQCYARQVPEADRPGAAPQQGAVAVARLMHRAVAVAALLLVIALVMISLARTPVLREQGRMALGLLALALFLAILGRWTANARVPAVMLGNLLAGFAMFALGCRLVQSTGGPAPADARTARLARWAWLGVALLVGQILLGGLVNAARAGFSCPQMLACDMAGGSWQLLNPWRETPLAALDPLDPAGRLVNGLHRLGALAVAGVLLPLGIAAWRRERRAGAVVIVLLVLQATLGLLLIAGQMALLLALAHNVTAALLLAAVLSLTRTGMRQPEAR